MDRMNRIKYSTVLNFGDGSRKLLKLYNLLKFLTSDLVILFK